MFWLFLGIVVGSLIYFYFVKSHSYWKNRGIPQTNPAPIFGDSWDNVLRRKAFYEIVVDIYNKAGDNRYIGMYQATIPTILIKDTELLKQVAVKDFDHFQDHRKFIPENIDPLWAKNIFALKGQRWKEMRSTLTPSFSSSKMKAIFVLVCECAQTLVDHFLAKSDDELKHVEMKDVFTRYANDVIASAAFGIKCNSLAQREHPFYKMGRKASEFIFLKPNIKTFIMIFLPRLAALLRLTVFTSDVTSFFRSIVKKTIESREEHGVVRPDMIHLLTEARKIGQQHEESKETIETGFATVQESDFLKINRQIKYQLSDDDITAQVLIFFFAGFDSAANQMSYVAYELALNPDVQKRLAKEVDDARESCEGELTYDILFQMKYLDMVISETLRKWPVAIAVDRVVTKPYTLPPPKPGENPIQLRVDDVLFIPIYAFHHDPKLYPNPEKFDPERFSDENRPNIKPHTYLPFGTGPRACIGSRFALLEIKIIVFYLLSNFEIVVNEKTDIPLIMDKGSFNLCSVNGFWLSLKRRKNAGKNDLIT